MAPGLLFVQGIGSFLLVSYAADRDAPISQAVRKADRAVLALLGGSLAMGAAATVLVGRLGPLVSGDEYDIDPLAAAGWAAVAASVAAGATGHPRRGFWSRRSARASIHRCRPLPTS